MTRQNNGRVSGGSPANIMRHIAGVSFPASKGDLLTIAKEKGAPPEVVQVLERLPSDHFSGPNEVVKRAFNQE